MLIHIIKDTHDIGRGSKCKVFWVLSAICSWVDFFWKFSKIGSKHLSGDIQLYNVIYHFWKTNIIQPSGRQISFSLLLELQGHCTSSGVTLILCGLWISLEIEKEPEHCQESADELSHFFPSTGWWFQPLWKIWKSVGIIIPNLWKHKKCSKPPTSPCWTMKTHSRTSTMYHFPSASNGDAQVHRELSCPWFR